MFLIIPNHSQTNFAEIYSKEIGINKLLFISGLIIIELIQSLIQSLNRA